MAKLTTLEGDFDFYGSTPARSSAVKKVSCMQVPEVMLGFSIGHALGVTSRVASRSARTVAAAPIKIAAAVVKAPVQLAQVLHAPTAVVSAVKALTYVPEKLVQAVGVVERNTIGTALDSTLKAPEVIYNKIISPVANVAMRNPLPTAIITGGASLIPQVMTQQGRSELLGKKSTIAQTAGFIQRHPYAFAIPTSGASIVADLFTQRGRQALAGKDPGYRTSPGLTGADSTTYINLKNTPNRDAAQQALLDALTKKGQQKVKKDALKAAYQKQLAAKAAAAKADYQKKLDEAKLAVAKANATGNPADIAAANAAVAAANAAGVAAGVAPTSAPSGDGSSGGGGGGSSGDTSTDPNAQPATPPASPLGGILLAAGLGALMIL
jgi:hypothetical protein